MITLESMLESKRQHIIEHVPPSEFDENIKEGLKKKEEKLKNLSVESMLEEDPGLLERIEDLNNKGISQEEYENFMNNSNGNAADMDTYKTATDTIYYSKNSSEWIKMSSGEAVLIIKNDKLKVKISLSGDLVDTYQTTVKWNSFPEGSKLPTLTISNNITNEFSLTDDGFYSIDFNFKSKDHDQLRGYDNITIQVDNDGV